MIFECSDALVPQSGFVQSLGYCALTYGKCLQTFEGMEWFHQRVKSSRKGGYRVQCNLRFTTNNQMSVVAFLY